MTDPEAQPNGSEAASKPLTAREKAKLNQVPANDPLIGQVIGGHYEVMECIGKGGMSVVYKCRHQLINQFRAVKVLLPHRDGESDFLLRFQLEATAASRLDNKHIVRVHDFAAPEASAPYLVMDYAEGQGLGDEIDKLGRLPVKRALAIFVQILDAIGHTHARGVIHRDLKPDNILLVNDEEEGADFVKLIDFGIAKLTAADKLQPQGLTPTGEIFGSPQYMSPEQCAGLTMDVRSEIYSLGCILYEMLSGKAPLMGKSVLDTLNMQAHTPPIPLAKLSLHPPLNIPDGLDDILLRCLAKKPEERFQTTDDLRKAITRLPSFDRRKRLQSKMLQQAGAPGLGLLAVAVIASFGLGFGAAKLLPGTSISPKDETNANQATGVTDAWQSLYLAGQKAIDDGDLAAATARLEEALEKANSLNDGQKRAAATGIDLCALDLIKQFKNGTNTDATAIIKPSPNYPDNPWETKISAISDLLRAPGKSGESNQLVFKATVSLLEESHKGNLSSLNELMNLAQDRLLKEGGLNARDKLHLAVLLATVEEEQGYYKRGRKMLEEQEPALEDASAPAALVAKYHFLRGRLALDDNDNKEAKTEAKKAKSFYEDNMAEYPLDLLETMQLASDISLARDDADERLKLEKQALAALEGTPPSDRLEWSKDKLLMQAAILDSGMHLNAALTQCRAEMDHEEAQAPKTVPHLITVLTMSYYLDKIKSGQATTGRPKLWRAMALALTTGRLGLASDLMHPLMNSYDTALTQKDMLVLGNNRLAIDETLAAAGNANGPALVLDYVALGEALEDFSLGPARNLKKARGYLEKATTLIAADDNREDHLTVARVYFAQARCAQERKVQPALVDLLTRQAQTELDRISHNVPDKDRDLAAQDLAKKIKDLQQDNKRSQSK